MRLRRRRSISLWESLLDLEIGFLLARLVEMEVDRVLEVLVMLEDGRVDSGRELEGIFWESLLEFSLNDQKNPNKYE